MENTEAGKARVEREVKSFGDIHAKLGERYEEHFLAIRTSDGRVYWDASDNTWAKGVCSRFQTSMDERDRIYERGGSLD